MKEKRVTNMKVIITDSSNRPMAWDKDQLCYCTDSDWKDNPFPIRVYTEGTARALIRRTIKFREENGFSIDEYKTMPVK